MDGSNWVALAAIIVGAGTTVTTLLLQNRRENDRLASERQERQDTRWIDDRRSVYSEFLREADNLQRAFRLRLVLLGRWFSDVAAGREPDDGLFEQVPDTGDAISNAAKALADMRLFAPASVTTNAKAFMEYGRELEYFSSIWHIVNRDLANGPEPLANLESTYAALQLAGGALVAAMRNDLGADAIDLDDLGNIDPTIYGC